MEGKMNDFLRMCFNIITQIGPYLYRPPKVRPKNLTIGGRYFYGKIQL